MPMMITNQKLAEIRKTKNVSVLSEAEILALVQEVQNTRKYLREQKDILDRFKSSVEGNESTIRW